MAWQQQVKRFEATFNYTTSDEWKKTEGLKTRIAEFRAQNPNKGLSIDFFNPIVEWKLRKQRGRTEAHRKALTEILWERLTGCAFSIQHTDLDVLTSVQVGILTSLPGVGIGLTTAILALTFPEVHGIIDYRVWKVVFQSDKRSFTTQDYIHYLCELRTFAKDAGWPMQKADFMIWSYYDDLTQA